jgi:hypothetical protein
MLSGALPSKRQRRPSPPEVASERIDLATLMFNYHDRGHLGVDRAAMNRAVFRALVSTLSPITRADPVPAFPNLAPCIAPKKRFSGRR